MSIIRRAMRSLLQRPRLRLQTDVDACHVQQLIAFSVPASDITSLQSHKRDVPVLEGACDGHAAVHPEPACTQVHFAQVGQAAQGKR